MPIFEDGWQHYVRHAVGMVNFKTDKIIVKSIYGLVLVLYTNVMIQNIISSVL